MNEIRNLSFLSWKQDTAWMESMKGDRWKNLVKKENELFEKEVSKISTKEEILSLTEQFEKEKNVLYYNLKNIIVKYPLYNSYEYTIDSLTYNVTDLDISDNYIFHIRDVGKGKQNYRLECLNKWHFNHVGPTLYLKGSKCYVLNASNTLWYNKVLEIDCSTGKVVRVLYEEKDPMYNLTLVKCEKTFFILRENSGIQNLMYFDKNLISCGRGTNFYPIDKLCYFEYINHKWKAVGFHFPHTIYGSIEYISLKDKIFIERRFGRKTIYSFENSLKPIYSYYGNLIINPWSYNLDTFYIDSTDGLIQFSYKNKLIQHNCGENLGLLKSSFTHNRVPYISIKPYCKVKGLLVIAYGAYGIPTNTSMWRWKPYLQDGWVIAFAFVRGSGDDSIEWAMEAKTYNKYKSSEDLEECIKALQKTHAISPFDTCIYGRSAGGYLVGSLVSRNPSGNLFKMVYTEVPYVDILRTTTNPKLPLTQMEYNEFGNPSNSIYEFQEILKLSPVDSLNKPPDIFVLVRTSENDSQVYTYESLKWIDALRGKKNDSTKLVYISKNEGHFNSSFINLAEDFILLKNSRENGF
jgi:hypothetical protein